MKVNAVYTSEQEGLYTIRTDVADHGAPISVELGQDQIWLSIGAALRLKDTLQRAIALAADQQ